MDVGKTITMWWMLHHLLYDVMAKDLITPICTSGLTTVCV